MRAVYPGSFDPVTNGHIDIIRRAAALVDELVVAVLINTAKNPLFTLEERLVLLRQVTADIPNVRVDSFSGLLINYMKERDIPLIIKGLRAISDFEAEFQMATDFGRELQPTVGDGPHEVDAAAGAVVFVAEFDVGRASGGAEAAVDAVEEEFVVDASAGVGGGARGENGQFERVW